MAFFIFTFSLLVLRMTLEQVEVIVLGTGGRGSAGVAQGVGVHCKHLDCFSGQALLFKTVMRCVCEHNTSAFVTAGEETNRTEAGVDRDRLFQDTGRIGLHYYSPAHCIWILTPEWRRAHTPAVNYH